LPKFEGKIENPSVYLCGHPGFHQELENNGIRVINEQSNAEEETCMKDDEFANYEVDPSVVAVVCGIDYNFSYRKISIANLYI